MTPSFLATLVATIYAFLLLMFAVCGMLFIFGGFRSERTGMLVLLILALAIVLLHMVAT